MMTSSWYTTAPLETRLRKCVRRAGTERARSQARTTRLMLERWVSELEPCLVFNRGGGLLGLTTAGQPYGRRPPIYVSVEEVER